jgi:MoaA/NifB/PqqE/SkfB family radical SAM enzyme
MYKRGESIAIVRIEYRYACNLMCSHCCISEYQVKDGRKLRPQDVASVSKQADELGLARMVLTGGEPLVFPDLNEVIKAIDPEKFYINVDSNGWLLDAVMAKRLKHLGCDRIQLSIDSLYPEEHDAFRCKAGSHARAMRAVDATLDAGLDLFIQTVVTKNRLYSDEFREFLRYFNSCGIGVFVTYGKPVGEWKNKKDDLIDIIDIDYMRNVLEKEHNVFTHITPAFGRDIGCIAVKAMISITAFGDVNPCPYWFRSMGNVFDEPLKDILARAMKTPPFDKHIDTCPVADVAWQGRL